MKIGFGTQTYEPHWNGNRDLPAVERIRFKWEPWAGRDMLIDTSKAAVMSWVKEHLEPRGLEVNDEDVPYGRTPQGQAVQNLLITSADELPAERIARIERQLDRLVENPQVAGARILMIVCRKTRDYENCTFPDGTFSDPLDVYLRLPYKLGQIEEDSLLNEAWNLLQQSSGMTEEEVKNFVERFDGRGIPGSESAPDAEMANGRSNADTPPGQTDSSTSDPPVSSEAAQPST